MREDEKAKGSWWHTLPGTLTALSGVVTAVAGLLVALNQTGVFSFKLEVWICMHETLRGTPRIRLMFDHLAKALGAYVAEVA